MKQVRSLLFSMRAVAAFARLVHDPSRLDVVFRLVDNIKDMESAQRQIARTLAKPHVAKAARARVRLPPICIEELEASCPEGSLGSAFARFLRQHSLNPADLPRRGDVSDADWLNAHLYETHDIWHVVTGFGPDVSGELGLQAFYAAQTEGMVPLAILSAGLLNTLAFKPGEKARRLDAIAEGYALGKAMHSFLGVDWASLFPQPLAQVRADLQRTSKLRSSLRAV